MGIWIGEGGINSIVDIPGDGPSVMDDAILGLGFGVSYLCWVYFVAKYPRNNDIEMTFLPWIALGLALGPTYRISSVLRHGGAFFG